MVVAQRMAGNRRKKKAGADVAASLPALNALPARIAVLDREGRILLVNTAWRDFAKKAEMDSDRAAAGDNYLTMCGGAAEGAPHRNELAEGLRLVLAGKSDEFVLEYPARLRTGEKWFDVRVTKCIGTGNARAVVAHEDISERVKLEQEIVAASAREQQRFRQDLHDGLSQQLTGLKFKASLLEYHLQSKNLAEAAEAKAISELLNQATDEASNLARQMRPVEIEARGLMMALKELAHTTSQSGKVACTVLIRRAVFIYDNHTATNLFRIAAEAVASAVKEGGAQRVQVGLTEEAECVLLTVRDNGRPLADRGQGNSGVQSTMRYYARMIGGTLQWRKDGTSSVSFTCCIHKQISRRK